MSFRERPSSLPAPGGVDVRVRVDAFIAADAAVLAAPNAAPPTITVPGTLTLRMTTAGTVASLQVVDADLVGNPLPGLDPLRRAVLQSLNRPIALDLAQSLGALRLLEFERAAVELTSETVAVRFDPVDAVRNPLRLVIHPQDYGLANAVPNHDMRPEQCFPRSDAVGGRNRDRTCDPLLVRQVLYR
jgi:hypothetical protein